MTKQAEATPHEWTRGYRGTSPALVCTRRGCQATWWPGARQPTAPCRGRRSTTTTAPGGRRG